MTVTFDIRLNSVERSNHLHLTVKKNNNNNNLGSHLTLATDSNQATVLISCFLCALRSVVGEKWVHTLSVKLPRHQQKHQRLPVTDQTFLVSTNKGENTCRWFSNRGSKHFIIIKHFSVIYRSWKTNISAYLIGIGGVTAKISTYYFISS